jgi:hypothetical protein
MRRLLAILTVLSVGLSACGDDEQQRSESSERACPEGTPSLQARDVIGTTPDGYKVVKGDAVAIERVADNVKQTMGQAFRDYDARVLARRRALNGTAVIVFNAKERIPPPDELLRQQETAEEKADVGADTISVGSADGRLYQAPDGGWVAVAPAGTCAMVLLVSDREELIRDAAIQVMNDGTEMP